MRSHSSMNYFNFYMPADHINLLLKNSSQQRAIHLLDSSGNKQRVNFPLCLAPMVGLSHVALREIIRDYTSPSIITPWPTEMLSSKRLPAENLKLTPETLISITEKNLVPQILGNSETEIRLSIQKLITELHAQAIDINMGCPVQKALRHNYGVALMGDSDYAAEVVRMAVRAASTPVSVKLRAVEKTGSIESLTAFVTKLVDAGASWICFHPRTAEEKRRGQADWLQIKSLRDNVSIPIVGNGDIQTANDVYEMLAQTQCDLVMVGRALAARPWMMWQVAEDLNLEIPNHLQHLKAPRSPIEEGKEYLKMLNRFVDKCEYYFGAELALRKIRFFVRTTSVWIDFGQTLISATTKCSELQGLRQNLIELETLEFQMFQRTELRQ